MQANDPTPTVAPVDTTTFDWIPLGPGLSFKPLRFFRDDAGYQLLLRIDPGTVIPPHRHTGEVHAFNVAGSRRIRTTGEVIGPATYVHEPVGNEDSWEAIGDEPCVVHLEANGRVEYLDDDGNVVRHTDAATARAEYLAWCRQHDIEPLRSVFR